MNKKPKVGVIDLTEVMQKMRGRENKEGRGKALLDILGDDVPDEVKKAVSDLVEQIDKENEGSEYKQKLESQAELLEYMAQPMPKVGEFVERNRFGMKRYRGPQGDIESAIVVEVYDRNVQEAEGNGAVNGVIAICGAEGVIKTFPVDLRHYKSVAASGMKAGTAH